MHALLRERFVGRPSASGQSSGSRSSATTAGKRMAHATPKSSSFRSIDRLAETAAIQHPTTRIDANQYTATTKHTVNPEPYPGKGQRAADPNAPMTTARWRLRHRQVLQAPPSDPPSPADRVAALAWAPTDGAGGQQGVPTGIEQQQQPQVQLAVAVAVIGSGGRPAVHLFNEEGRRVDRIPLKPAVKVRAASRYRHVRRHRPNHLNAYPTKSTGRVQRLCRDGPRLLPRP